MREGKKSPGPGQSLLVNVIEGEEEEESKTKLVTYLRCWYQNEKLVWLG